MLKPSLLSTLCAVGLSLSQCSAFAEQASEPDLTFFESKVRPLLVEHCYECHGPDQQEGELRVDNYAQLLAGGTSGASIVPGNVEESLLLAAVSYRDEALQMPPDGKLSDEQIAILTQWIANGARHPDEAQTQSITPRKGKLDLEAERKFWAFQPIQRPEVPPLDSDWIQNPIDAFILAELTNQGLTAAPQADKRTLIRRATFDLIGLPPTTEEVEAFLADHSPDAFARVVDRLLSSEHYGERWGRHWLDVARYADSNGLDENIAHGNAWRYRDYVVGAFNADKPYDRFVLEQVAGDLLVAQQQASAAQPAGGAEPPPVTPLSPSEIEALVATGFLVLGPKVLAEGDQDKLQMDIIDEQIDTLGRAVVGMTWGCARCHDHKFDPISIEDYYALAGIFKSTRTMESLKRIAKWNENVIVTAEQLVAIHKDGEIDKAKLPTAMGVQDGEIADTRVHVRGSHLTLGKTVPRALPAVLAPEEPLEFDSSQSGRLQLARWLASEDNPLTARVIVNRLWRWHFGKGLVSTPDNFGLLGQPPSHPQLLDWLAAELVANDWSLKALHRRIMLSSTYQLSSESNETSAAVDPDNRYHWRADIRRLEAEIIRDALLAASGTLDKRMGGSMLHVENRAFLFDHTSKDTTSYDSFRRSLYLPVIRNNLYDGFSLFDYNAADVPNGDRETSTVATQALFVMNSDLVINAAEALAARVRADHPQDDQAAVRALYQRALSREPSDRESQRLLNFIASFSQHLQQSEAADDPSGAAWVAACQAILATNEFIYVK